MRACTRYALPEAVTSRRAWARSAEESFTTWNQSQRTSIVSRIPRADASPEKLVMPRVGLPWTVLVTDPVVWARSPVAKDARQRMDRRAEASLFAIE